MTNRTSRALLAMALDVCAFGVWLPFSPFAPALGLAALPARYLALVAFLLVCYLLLTQMAKAWLVRRFPLL